MKILAIDTATERCSVALRIDGSVIERVVDTARGHADLILPMVEAVLAEGGLGLRQLDGIAFGRGPGAFTGVRIAVGVVQGLAFGAQLLTLGVSDLAAVAQQTAQPGDNILVCMDARMGEVYWSTYRCGDNGLVTAMQPERVGLPATVDPIIRPINRLAGTGIGAYPQIVTAFPGAEIHDNVLPRARDIALLGEAELLAGRGLPAAEAQPIYVRDQVAVAKQM
jgi:tRNA threonylcarbamoyladenosine biosynthesis protein TsaB